MRERAEQPQVQAGVVELSGDAHIMLTAAFYLEDDPLETVGGCALPDREDLDGNGTFLRHPLSLDPLLRGTLTFQQPDVDHLAGFVADTVWCDQIRAHLNEWSGDGTIPGFDHVDAVGMLFPDGYGSIAVTLQVSDGWERHRRPRMLATVDRRGRDELASELRSQLLPPIASLLHRCAPDRAGQATLPYFNLTYGGQTDHPEPGRGTIADELRSLVFPDSAEPLRSRSPWRDEFLYPGYALNLLATADPVASLEKLRLLLLVIDVSYVRLARSAEAAQRALETGEIDTDLLKLVRIENQLRSEYQSLVAPTFSFDHHALMLRDAFLRAWQADRLQTLTYSLLAMVRQHIEQVMAAAQARRTARINVVVTVLTVLSAVATVEAAVSLYDYFSP